MSLGTRLREEPGHEANANSHHNAASLVLTLLGFHTASDENKGKRESTKLNLTALCHLTKLLLQTQWLQVYIAKNVWVQNLFQAPVQGCVMVNVSCLSNQ